VICGWNASILRASEALDTFLIGDDPDNGRGGERAGCGSVYKSLEIGAATGNQNGQLGRRRRFELVVEGLPCSHTG